MLPRRGNQASTPLLGLCQLRVSNKCLVLWTKQLIAFSTVTETPCLALIRQLNAYNSSSRGSEPSSDRLGHPHIYMHKPSQTHFFLKNGPPLIHRVRPLEKFEFL